MDTSIITGEFGQRLRREREAKGMTRAALSGAARCHWNTLARVERGEERPSLELAARLARALEVPLDRLLDGAEGGRR